MLVSITNKTTILKSIKIDFKRDASVFKRLVHSVLLCCIEKCQLSSFSNTVCNRFFRRPVRRPAGRVIIL